MRRFALVTLLLAGLLATSGCLRNRIDLCAMVPPHPECAFLDAGVDAPPVDASVDAPVDAAVDAAVDAPSDAPPDAADAP